MQLVFPSAVIGSIQKLNIGQVIKARQTHPESPFQFYRFKYDSSWEEIALNYVVANNPYYLSYGRKIASCSHCR